METAYMTTLINGNMVEAVIDVYRDIMGDWWWVWFFGLSFMMLYSKSRDYASVGVIGLAVFSIVVPVLPPVVHLFVYVLLALALTNILYKLYH